MRVFDRKVTAGMSRSILAFAFVCVFVLVTSVIDRRTSASGKREIAMQLVASDLTSPRLLAYHAPTNNLIVATGAGGSIGLLNGKETTAILPAKLLTENDLQDPRNIATVTSHTGAFDYGDIFIGYSGGRIARVHADTSEVEILRLTGENATVQAIAADETGLFGGALLALLDDGTLWSVAPAREPRIIAELGSGTTSMAFVGEDGDFGPLAGKVVVSAPGEKRLYGVSPSGEVTVIPVETAFSRITFVQSDESIFASSAKKGAIYAAKIASESGILAATTVEGNKIYSLRFDNGQMKASFYDVGEQFDEIAAVPLTMGSRPAACVTSVVPNASTFQWRGGEGAFAVNAPAGCAWTASSSSPWLQIVSGSTGSGNGNVAFYTGKNVADTLRQSGITVDGRTHTVNQSKKAQFACNVTLSNPAPNVAAIGGTGTITVSQGPDCAWTAVSTDPWLTLTNASGSGNGSFSYSATTNFGAQARQASVIFPNISGQYALVTQAPNQAPTVSAGPTQTITLPSLAALSGTVTDDGVGNPVTTSWTKVSGPESVLFSNASNLNTNAIFNREGTYVLRLTASDGYLTSSANVTVNVGADTTPPPPDPATVAPPVNMTVASNIVDSTRFLYSGANPIQTGVAAGAIKGERVNIFRGRVVSRGGSPLPNVTVKVLDHPELGQTRTRADGMFDMAVNGGGEVMVNYEKLGYITVQRQEETQWQAYRPMDDVVMIPYDGNVSPVDLAANIPIQVAESGVITDSSGTRRSRLLFKQGTTATEKFADGTTRPLTTLSVRSTEFTVGANGPETMPGSLPGSSSYTYSVEYSIDEAVAAGAVESTFSQPVIQYNENFLRFPTGTVVPSGSYDRITGQWVPSLSGIVVKILSISSGTANLDVTGAGQPATEAEYAALGINVAERQTLATLYTANQSLWRVPLLHFSAWDSNWGSGPPRDAVPPPPPPPLPPNAPPNPDECQGCIIGMQGQTLGDEIGLTGTQYFLRYDSNRQRGRLSAFPAPIFLSGPSLPASVKRIELTVSIAGQVHSFTFPSQTNQSTTFTWDGLDSYGRALQGQQDATIDVGYVYDAVYVNTGNFGFNGNGIPITGDPSRSEVTLHRIDHTQLGVYAPPASDLGGWTLNVHHEYNPTSKVLHQGDGVERRVETVNQAIETFAGNGTAGSSGDGGPAVAAQLDGPGYAIAGPDGSVYIADSGSRRIRKVDLNGTITTAASQFTGSLPFRVALAPNGGFITTDNCNIIRIAPDGQVSVIGGSYNQPGFSGDGGPATAARFSGSLRTIVGPDGSLYVSDTGNNRIRKIGTDGVVRTIAGNGLGVGFGGDGGPATEARLYYPSDLAVSPDGTLYFLDHYNYRVRKVTPDGIITTVAGTGAEAYTGDGGPATQAGVAFGGFFEFEAATLGGICLGPDGSIYFTQSPQRFGQAAVVRKVTPDGTISSIAGTTVRGDTGDGGPAPQAQLTFASLSIGPDGSIYIAGADVNSTGGNKVRRILAPLPGFTAQETVIPSEDGTQLFQFDAAGRHLRTTNALTNAVMFTFGYDAAGRLTTVTDGDNNITTVERDGSGNPTGILSPYGQRTAFTRSSDGFLASVTDPAGSQNQFTYSAGGLMATKRDPRNNLNTFSYDALGNLTRDADAAGGTQTLTRTGTAYDYTVSRTTASAGPTLFRVQSLSNGNRVRTNTFADGTTATQTKRSTGINSYVDPGGTVATETVGGDPRFKFRSPQTINSSISTPGGLNYNEAFNRNVTLSNPADILSLVSQTDTTNINGRSFSTAFNTSTRTFVDTSPQNRTMTATTDAQGRITRFQFADLNAVSLTYDGHGRLNASSVGTGGSARSSGYAYNQLGQLASFTNPLNQVSGFTYDLAGRVTQQTLADSRITSFGYDSTGNLTSVTPPGRTAHTFGYTVLDQVASYTAPNVGGNSTTSYQYSLDGNVTRITRPDGLQLNYDYDTAGRLRTLTSPSGSYNLAYNSVTGLLETITAPGGETVGYQYDGNLPLGQTWAGAVSGSVSQAYDSNFRVSSQAVNGTGRIDFTYDNDDLLLGAGSLTFTRNPQNGLLTGSTLSNVSDTTAYNEFGAPSSYNARFNSSTLYDVGYTYDKLGRIIQKVETIGGVTTTSAYGFDATGRLATVTLNGGPQPAVTYGYDSNDNRTSYNTIGSSITGTYDAQDRLTNYGAAAYSYSSNGELQNKTVAGQTTQYDYDVSGNLKAVTLPNGAVVQYLIDGQDRRIGRRVNGTLTQEFLYQNQLEPVAELDGSGNIVSRFVFGSRVNSPDYMVRGGRTYRIVSDQLGSVRLVVDSISGSIAQRIDYDEFGVVLLDTNPGFQPFGFAGGLYDPSTGLTRFGSRDYDAQTGRWTAKDQSLFAGGDTNLYSYVRANPINLLDLSGEAPTGFYEQPIPFSPFTAEFDFGPDGLKFELKAEAAFRIPGGGKLGVKDSVSSTITDRTANKGRGFLKGNVSTTAGGGPTGGGGSGGGGVFDPDPPQPPKPPRICRRRRRSNATPPPPRLQVTNTGVPVRDSSGQNVTTSVTGTLLSR